MRAWLLVLALGAALALLLVDARRGSVFDGAFANAREAWSLAPAPPSQVHVALFDDTSVAAAADGGRPRAGMAVSWATSAKTRSSTVRYGQAREALELSASADAPCARYAFCDYVSPWFHHVVLPADSLLPDTLYYYQCGDDIAGWSEVRSFRTVVPIGSPAPLTFGVIGDLGQTVYSEQTLRHLSGVDNMSAILHAGDLSYADSEQKRWDRWGRLVEPLASRMPWMVSSGNHERERPCQPEVSAFVAYQERFRMPFARPSRLQRRNLYYAFRVGLVHFIVLTPYVDSSAASLQYQWLQEELAARVDRERTPWLVVIMHGPWYNSNTAHQGHEPHMDMKQNMESLLFRYHADLVIAGHVHAYERSHPVYKEQVRADGIVYVVLGDAGNREGLAPTYVDPQPSWSAFRQADYGFGLLSVWNRSHASLAWLEDRATGDAQLRDHVELTTSAFRQLQDQ